MVRFEPCQPGKESPQLSDGQPFVDHSSVFCGVWDRDVGKSMPEVGIEQNLCDEVIMVELAF